MRARLIKQQLGSWFYKAYGALWRQLHSQPHFNEKVESVLVLNLLRIGDTIVTFPALEQLRKLYPQAHITLVVRQLVEPLVSHLSSFDSLIVHKGDHSRESCQSLQEKLPPCDLAVVLDTSPWVSVAAFQAGCRRIVAFDSLGRGFAATDRVAAPVMWNVAVPDYDERWEVPYQGDAWLKLIHHLGAPHQKAIPIWEAPEQAISKINQWLHERKISRFLLIHPGSDASYQWPIERYQEVIKNIGLPVVLGGASFDQDLCAQVSRESDNLFHWCGEGDLAVYGALLSKATHVLSVDTSAAHLAAAVGTPVSVLFGPGDPQIWGPRGRCEIAIIQATSKCIGCKSATCFQSTHECMLSIDADRVINHLKEKFS